MFFCHKFDGFTFKRKLNDFPEEQSSMLCEHFHTNYELLYFLRGDVRFEIEAMQYILKPHTLLIIKPGMHHQAIVNPNEDYERIVVNFFPKDLPSNLAVPLSKCPIAVDVEGTELERLFTQFSDQDKKYDNELLLQEVFKCTLTYILLLLCFQDNKPSQVEHLNHQLAAVMQYIEKNLRQINTVSDIARGVFVSESTIRKLFSQYAGIPVMTYVRGKKIMLAHDLIQNGIKPQKACEECGFQDYSTFFRVYKKFCSESPSETFCALSERIQL